MDKNELRSEKLLKNATWATVGYLAYAIAGFVSRSVFIYKLGNELTGVSTLFNSILNLLSMAELGISGAISIHLYKPVADGDERKIAGLLNLYRKAYRVISLVVLGLGLSMLPFIEIFVKTDAKIPHLKWYFFLYVLRTVFSYCYAYKGTLISVYQEEYRKTNISNALLIISTILQTVTLYFTSSYTLYILIYVTSTLLTNVLISREADKCYPYLNQYKEETVSPEEKRSIFSYIKADSINKAASSIKTATDSMIISTFVNVVVTGIVGNYNMVVNTVNTVLGFFFTSSIPSVGNMMATTDKRAQYNTFLDLEFIAFWIYGFLGVGMLCTLTPFVRDVWIRQDNLILGQFTLFLLVLNFFITGTSIPVNVFFTAKGLIQKIPYLNIVNVLINLVLSLWLVQTYDVDGVYIGTVISFILSSLPLMAYMVLRHHFDGNYIPYVKLYGYYFLVVFLSGTACVAVCNLITPTGLVGIACRVLACTLVFNGIFLLASFWTREFRSILSLVRNIVKKR